MGAILSPALDAIRAMNAKATAQNVHHDARGDCLVMLADLPVLATYEATPTTCGEIIEVMAVSINGHEVPNYMFDAETLKAWADDIAKDRADDLRIAREAAESDAGWSL